jgi:hypothetical protein
MNEVENCLQCTISEVQRNWHKEWYTTTCNGQKLSNAKIYIIENNRSDTHSLFSNNLVECCNLKCLFRYTHDPASHITVYLQIHP